MSWHSWLKAFLASGYKSFTVKVSWFKTDRCESNFTLLSTKTFSRNVSLCIYFPLPPKHCIQKSFVKEISNRQTNAQMSCLLQWCIRVDTMRQLGQGRWNRSQAMGGLTHPFVIATEVILGNCRKCLLWPCPRAAICYFLQTNDYCKNISAISPCKSSFWYLKLFSN